MPAGEPGGRKQAGLGNEVDRHELVPPSSSSSSLAVVAARVRRPSPTSSSPKALYPFSRATPGESSSDAREEKDAPLRTLRDPLLRVVKVDSVPMEAEEAREEQAWWACLPEPSSDGLPPLIAALARGPKGAAGRGVVVHQAWVGVQVRQRQGPCCAGCRVPRQWPGCPVPVRKDLPVRMCVCGGGVRGWGEASMRHLHKGSMLAFSAPTGPPC